MRFQRGVYACQDVACRANLEWDLALGKVADQHGIFDRADAVPDSLDPERVQSIPDALGTQGLAGVDRGPEPALAGKRVDALELPGRIQALGSAERQPDHGRRQQRQQPLKQRLRRGRPIVPHQIHDPAHPWTGWRILSQGVQNSIQGQSLLEVLGD